MYLVYTLCKKKVAYLIAFVDWFQRCKVRKNVFVKPGAQRCLLRKGFTDHSEVGLEQVVCRCDQTM